MKNLHKLVLVLAAGALWTAESSAAVQFDLNCLVESSVCTDKNYSYGTITIDENTADNKKVDITIDITGTGTKPLELWLNIDPALASLIEAGILNGPLKNNGTPDYNHLDSYFSAVRGSASLSVAFEEDALGSPDALKIFDVDIPKGANLGNAPEPVVLTLSLTIDNILQDLNPAQFNFAAPLGSQSLFALVHVGSCADLLPGCTDSIKVGALEKDGGNPGGNPVAEPTSLALLGIGLLGVGLARRRQRC